VAQLAIAVAGSYVGGAIGGAFGYAALGSSIGWAIGSYAGAVAFAPKQRFEGPRLGDGRTQTSIYGRPVANVFGRFRISGNVIDQSEQREVRTEREEGGKGGPSVTTTTYSYFIDGDIAFCRGPITGFEKIWFNGKLVYDGGEELIEDEIGSVGFARLVQRALASMFTVDHFYPYIGASDQEPDPTFEALHGVGLVPGYVNTAHLVLANLPVTEYGGMLPQQIDALVLKTGDESGPRRIYGQEVDQLETAWTGWDGIGVSNSTGPWIRGVDGTTMIVAELESTGGGSNPMLGTAIRRLYFDVSFGEILHEAQPVNTGFSTVSDNTHSAQYASVASRNILWNFTSADGRWMVRTIAHPDYSLGDESGICVIQSIFDGTWDDGFGWNDCVPADIKRHASGPYIGKVVETAIRGVIPCVDFEHFLVVYQNTSDVGAWELKKINDGFVQTIDSGLCDDVLNDPLDTRYIACAGQNTHFMSGALYQVGMMESDMRHVWVIDHGGLGGSHLYQINPDTNVFEPITDATGMTDPEFGEVPLTRQAASIWADKGICYTITGAGNISMYSRLPEFSADLPTLEDVCTEICEDCGYTAEQLDFSAFSGITVKGYGVTSQMAGRAALEPLMLAYNCGIVESNAQLKGVVLADVASVEVDAADLLLSEEGQQSMVVSSERAHESEIPARITVRYIDEDADHQVGAQSAARFVTSSVQALEIDLSVVMNADEAAQVADVQLTRAWVERMSRKFSLTRKYASVEPLDVLVVPDGNVTYTVRILRKTEVGARLDFEGVDHDAAIFTSNAVGQTIDQSQDIEVVGASMLEIVDEHPLTNSETPLGVYLATAHYGESQPGAAVFRAKDGVTYARVDTVAANTMGTAETALGDWEGGNVIDTANTVTVKLVYGSLSSCTFSELHEAATNVAMLGNEMIKFMTATSLGDGRYTLSNLLRGRRGTRGETASHEERERFVLLTTTLGFARHETDDIGDDFQFKAATNGRTDGQIVNVAAQDFTLTGNILKPMPPPYVRGTWLANGDTVIQWGRRARYNSLMRDGVGVPLDETSEAYDLEILSADQSEVVRTFSNLTSQSQTYAAADQSTDFDGIVHPRYWVNVYQKSETVGRGRAAVGLARKFHGDAFERFYYSGALGDSSGSGFDLNPWPDATLGWNTEAWAELANLPGSVSDFALTFDITTLEAGLFAGFLFRTSNFTSGNQIDLGYSVRFDGTGGANSVRIYRAGTSVATGTYGGGAMSDVRIECVGGVIRVWFEEDLLQATYTDGSPLSAGGFGVIATTASGTTKNAVFENLRLEY
jgi:hypothetical protein